MQSIKLLEQDIIKYLDNINIKYDLSLQDNSITLSLTGFDDNIQFVLNSKDGWDIFILPNNSINNDLFFNDIFNKLEDIAYNINDMFYPLNKDQKNKFLLEKNSFLNLLEENSYRDLIKSISQDKYKIHVELIDYKENKPRFTINYIVKNDIWAFSGYDMIENANIIDDFYNLFQAVSDKINELNEGSLELFI